MPRHVVRDRFREEENIHEIMESMKTYEETTPQEVPEEMGWPNNWLTMFRLPDPGKILKLGYFDRDEFTVRKSPFFSRRQISDGASDDESGPEEEETGSTISSSVASSSQEDSPRRKLEAFTILDSYFYVQRTVIVSRIYILLLQFIGANFLMDFHTDAFRGADYLVKKGEWPMEDFIVHYLLGGLRRWDAQHFLFLCDVDYIYEKSLAFLPGFVGVVNIGRFYVTAYAAILFGIEVKSWVATTLSAVIINLIAFLLVAVMLYLVAYQLTRSVKVALMSVTLFSFNPSSIFFTAIYSECLFMLITVTALLMIMSSTHFDSISLKVGMTCMSSLFFGSSTLVRSNGLMNVGYAMWYTLSTVLWESEDKIPKPTVLKEKLITVRNRRARDELTRDLRRYQKLRRAPRKICRFVAKNRHRVVSIIIVVSFASIVLVAVLPPFVIYGTGMSEEYCDPESVHSKFSEGYVNKTRTLEVVAGQVERLSFCKNMFAFGFWPKFYGLVQHRYWEVGLFRYWQLKKLPCFLLASPALIISFIAIRSTFDEVFRVKKWNNAFVILGRLDHLLPYAVHSAILMFVAVFVINTEVYTRIIFSSSPFLYVFLAKWLDGLTQGNVWGNRMTHYMETYSLVPMFITRHIWNSGWAAKLFIIYFVSYFVFGTIAHAAWLPFT